MKGAIASLAASLFTAAASAQVDVNRVIAVVNGEEIRGAEYYRKLETMDLKEAYQRFRERLFSYPLGFVVMDQLIQERVLLQLAKEKGALPSDFEIRAELDRLDKENPKAREQWASLGRTPEELTGRIRMELAGFKLQTMGITVTDQEIDKYYKDNPLHFTTPRRYKLRVIVVTDVAKKTIVDSELKSGVGFAEVARKHSDDVSKIAGGDYGAVPITNMPDTYKKPIAATKIGQATDWIESNKQFAKFLVEDISPEKLSPLDPSLRTEIRRKMMLDRGRVKIDVAKEINAKLIASKIDVRQKEFAETYERFLESLREQTVKPPDS